MPKADWRPARLKSWNFLAGVDSPWPRISLPSRRPMARSISNSRNIEQWLRWKQESYLSSGLITIGEIRMHLPWNDPFFKWCERMLKKLAADLMTPLPNDNLNKRIIMKIIFEVNFFVHVVSLCCFHNSHFRLETIPGVGIASSRLFCCFWRGRFRNRLLFWRESLQRFQRFLLFEQLLRIGCMKTWWVAMISTQPIRFLRNLSGFHATYADELLK